MALSACMAGWFGDAAERLLDLGGWKCWKQTYFRYFRLVLQVGSQTRAASRNGQLTLAARKRASIARIVDVEKRELPGRKWSEKGVRSCDFFVIGLVIDGNRHYEVDCGAKGPKVRIHWRDRRIQNALSLQKPNPSVAKQATPRDTGALS
jgi:hypothetical protein